MQRKAYLRGWAIFDVKGVIVHYGTKAHIDSLWRKYSRRA
jgi:hypothetical protein